MNNKLTSGSKKAVAVIMRSKVKKADVVALALQLPDEELTGAETAFSHQGPTLWRWWCAGVQAREKAKKLQGQLETLRTTRG